MTPRPFRFLFSPQNPIPSAVAPTPFITTDPARLRRSTARSTTISTMISSALWRRWGFKSAARVTREAEPPHCAPLRPRGLRQFASLQPTVVRAITNHAWRIYASRDAQIKQNKLAIFTSCLMGRSRQVRRREVWGLLWTHVIGRARPWRPFWRLRLGRRRRRRFTTSV